MIRHIFRDDLRIVGVGVSESVSVFEFVFEGGSRERARLAVSPVN